MNKIDLTKVSIGTDPEAFVINVKTGEIISAIGLIPGDKDEPFPISPDGHAIQTDNVMVEFCVPPANNAEQLNKDIRICIEHINNMLPENTEVTIIASSIMAKKYLKHPQAKKFGCDPDYNIYNLAPNIAPNAKTDLRSAGGHIHVGYENPNFEHNMKIVMAMDLFLGIPSIILDEDKRRKEMYGKSGAYREKPYGIEYRVLSNFWIKDEETVKWAFDQTMKAVQFASEEDFLDDQDQMQIQLAINNQDLDIASEIAKKFNISLTYKEKELV